MWCKKFLFACLFYGNALFATDIAIGTNGFSLLEFAPNGSLELSLRDEWGIGINVISTHLSRNWTEFSFYSIDRYRASFELRKYAGLFNFLDVYSFKMGGFIGAGYQLSKEQRIRHSALVSLGFRGSYIAKDLQVVFPFLEGGIKMFVGNTEKAVMFEPLLKFGIIFDFTPEMIPRMKKGTKVYSPSPPSSQNLIPPTRNEREARRGEREDEEKRQERKLEI